MSDALHAILDEELADVAVAGHVEVRSSYLCDDKLNFESACKYLRLAQLHDSFLQVVIAGHGRNDNINIFALALEVGGKLAQFCHKLACVITQALLQAWHLEVMGMQMLITEVLAKRVCKLALATAWNTSD